MKVVELFAGVGGFRLGLERTSEKFDTVWANQWEPNKVNQFAFNCYSSHFEKGVNELSNTDVFKVVEKLKKDESIIPDFDLLVGGFPCQDYSVATTKAKGIEGKKGVLWWAINDIINIKNPSYIMLENVDRLLKSPTKQRGRDFMIILKCLYDAGYDVEWRVLNAAEYGMPQKRRRVFIFAYLRKDKNIISKCDYSRIYTSGVLAQAFPVEAVDKNDYRHKLNENTGMCLCKDILEISENAVFTFQNAGVCIDGNIFTCKVVPKYVGKYRTLGEIIESTADERFYIKPEEMKKIEYVKGSKKIPRISKAGHQYMYSEGTMKVHEDLDGPARTMLTSESTIGRSSHFILDPITQKTRKITPDEADQINCFPSGWTAKGGLTDRQRYFCMGNALVVDIVERIGNVIKDYKINY